MKEGEAELGGLQVPHRDVDTSIPTPGPQPDPFATLNPRPLQSQPSPQISVSPAPQPPISQTPAQPIAQPTPPASAPVITTGSPVISPTPTPRQFPTQSISSGTGDILLSPAPAKKSKKWPTVAAITLASIVIASVVALLIINIKSAQNASAEASFSKFINYLTTGDDTEISSPEIIDPESNYAIDEYFNSDDEEGRKKYFENLNNIWIAFSSAYDKEESANVDEDEDEAAVEVESEDDIVDESIEEDEEIIETEDKDEDEDENTDEINTSNTKTSIVDEISDNLQNIITYLGKGSISQETILSKYLENGEDSVWDYYLSYYDVKDDQSKTIESFLNEQSFRIENIIEFIELSSENSCIQNNAFNNECIVINNLDQSWPYLQILDSESSIEAFSEETIFNIKELTAQLQQDMEQQYEEE